MICLERPGGHMYRLSVAIWCTAGPNIRFGANVLSCRDELELLAPYRGPHVGQNGLVGTWGVGIFSNDTAADLRDDFRDLVAGGQSAEAATRRLEEHYGVGQDQDFDNDFWLGLAATQHRLGHVDEHVIQQALAIIDSSAELQRWQPADRRRRSAVLGKLRDTLTQPPPQPRKVRPRKTVNTALSAGQHVVVPSAHGHGVLLRVVGVNEDKGGRYAIVIAVAWDGNERTLRKAHRLRPLLDPRAIREGEAFGFTLIGEPSDPPDLRVLTAECDEKTPTTRWRSGWVAKWSELHRFFGPDGTPTILRTP